MSALDTSSISLIQKQAEYLPSDDPDLPPKDDPDLGPQILHRDDLASFAVAPDDGASDFHSVPARVRSLEVLHVYPDAALSVHAGRLESMGALDILRESITILRSQSSTLMPVMLLLICPVSGLLLSRSLLHGMLAKRVADRLYVAASSVGLFHYLSLVKSLYESLSQVLLLYTFSAPVLFTVWLLAKASVVYIVSCSYTDRTVSLSSSIAAGARLWKGVFCTYLWSWLILVGFGAMAAVLFVVAVSLLDALEFSADLIFLTEVALGLFYSVMFAQMLVIGNLACVVATLEGHCGVAALLRSFYLIKGKIQVALSLFCGMLLGTVMVESLYQYRVIGIPPSKYAIDTASRLWEGPLLVLMYSFLLLLDGTMGCVFYFMCKASILVSG